MPVGKTITAQVDFSAGELDGSAKRTELAKVGARQLSNWRIINSKSVRNRPGRSALQAIRNQGNSRYEEISILGQTFYLTFAAQTLVVFNAAQNQVLFNATLPFLGGTLNQIDYAQIGQSIYITYPNMQPQVLSWDGTTWSLVAFSFAVTAGGQVRAPFYRLSPKGITMQPSGTTGSVTLTFSRSLLISSLINTRMRYCGRQMILTAITNGTTATATVIEPLPPGQELTVSPDPRNSINVGDEIIGQTTGAKGLVTATSATKIDVQLMQVNTSIVATAAGGGKPTQTSQSIGFANGEVISGPGGSVTIGSSASVSNIAPQAVSVWDDEVINVYRGYPQSVLSDQGRLVFSNLQGLARGIVWSAINAPTDCYPDAPPDAAIFEITPDDTTVQYIVPGPESSEIVFCSNRIYYIPINATNPLKPGSVAFNKLWDEGSLPFVRPRGTKEIILFIGAGGKSLNGVVATGAYLRPYNVQYLSQNRSHLFNSPVAIAVPKADSTFTERYAYILNAADGSVISCRYELETGQIKGMVGMLPWTSVGTVNWISAQNANVWFCVTYPGGGTTIVELLDDTQYLDAAVPVNALPLGMTYPLGGKGPLWWLPNSTVFLIDQGTRFMGIYQTDANGNIIPQFIDGENLQSQQLVAGQMWTATLEPFVPPAQPGADQLQRMRKRRVARAEIYVRNSSGFRFDTMYAEQQGPNIKPPGTVTRSRRVPTWNQDDDPTQPPHLFERAYTFKPTGRAHDPRIAVVKDTPGPLEVLEFGMEVTV